MNIHLRLLGTVQIEQEGQVVRKLGSKKSLALLGYLVSQKQAVSRSTLAGLLWVDKAVADGRRDVRWALNNLSKLLPGCFDTTPSTIRFVQSETTWVDTTAFEALIARGEVDSLAEAVTLYRGEFMAGLDLDDCPEFEIWLVQVRETWQQRVIQALEKLIDHHTQAGRYPQAQQFVARLLDLIPWREEAHRHMMWLLTISGRRSAALAQYQTCRRILAEALEVEPSSETVALYEQIKTGALSQVAGKQECSETPLPPFVARERELAQLGKYLDVALAGRGQVVFVTGEAGSGTTTLMHEFARRAQEKVGNLIVASANCNDLTGLGDPYLPFREILSQLTGHVEFGWAGGSLTRTNTNRLRALAPVSIRALVDLGPKLIDSFISGAALVSQATALAPAGAGWLDRLKKVVARQAERADDSSPRPNRIFAQYTQVLQTVARQQPLLLLLDDLHWADLSSINLLFHLGRRVEASPILLVGSYRPDEITQEEGDGQPHPLQSVLSEFKRRFGEAWIDLDQASQERSRDFVDTLLETEPNRLGEYFRQELARHTGGNPLFITELLRDMQERGILVRTGQGQWVQAQAITWNGLPSRVEGVIEKRLGRLEAKLRQILIVACVEGAEFTAEVVARVQGVDELAMIQALSSELDKRHGLIVSQGSQRLASGGQRLSRYRFRHNLFQQYLYHSLDAAERVYLHEAVGNTLEALYGEQVQQVATVLACHFQAAGLMDRAVGYLLQAGHKVL